MTGFDRQEPQFARAGEALTSPQVAVAEDAAIAGNAKRIDALRGATSAPSIAATCALQVETRWLLADEPRCEHRVAA